ncbi:SH3 domain-containing protein [Leptospira sp. GIMC2001]|uniref:SH3 domain-containing protein n=1 Tax=Leptospira sp. GIMC2001 TaxID=1513297 RepID=UPI00234A2D43|nr:SH3 domain-containing protein [Leptospira sp. GIMC2001]WCL49847.1 SH3 domain-containing protein [Leptospira sp. GIMC2001]
MRTKNPGNKNQIFYLVFILIFFFFNSNLLFSDDTANHWNDSIVLKKLGKSVIFAENVNIREKPESNSKVIAKLQPGTKIEILELTNIKLTIGNQTDHWYKIKVAGSTGYIWGALIADRQYPIGKNRLLIRNLGVRDGKIEIRILDNAKTITKEIFETGPIGLESEFKFRNISMKGLSNPPKYLIGIDAFIYSEIEYGLTQEFIFTIDANWKIKKQFHWQEAACDPPSCADYFLLMPTDSLSADPKTKRKEAKGKKDKIVILNHFYDIDEPNSHDFSFTEYKWNGSDFTLE